MIAHDIQVFRDLFSMIPDRPPPRLISTYVEGRRVLPTNTPFPGPWRNARAPYLVEPMDNMSPYSPVQIQTIRKPRKVGLTTDAENVVGYWIENPAEVLYVTASDDLALDWATKKLPPLIQSLGLQHLITASTESAKSRRSGDSTYRKEYIGGALDITSARSLMARRALDKRILIIDEADGVPILTSTGEGNWIEVLIGHTISWGARKKVMIFSSPTTVEASNTTKYYEQGDERIFLVPCPICGEHIELKMGNEQSAYGLKADTKGGKLAVGYYLTQCCGEAIFNHQKLDMYSPIPRCLRHPEKELRPAFWEPTKILQDPTIRSYGMNSLYSPLGMLSFTDLLRKREQAEQEGPDGRRSFTNLYEGLPYKDTAARPSREAVLAHRGAYTAGTIPAGVLYLVASVDVQQGSAKDQGNPERLELQVMGTGAGYRTWSIIHKTFKGDTSDAFSGAWEDMNQFAEKGGLQFERPDGRPIGVKIVGIDSGDAAMGRSETVYRFCQRWKNTFPIKGFSQLVADPKKREKGDIAGASGFKKYRAAAIGMGGQLVYEISTHFYKNIIVTNLNIPRNSEDPQRPGFMDFPRKCDDYDDEWFEQLNGTEKNALDGSFHDIRKRVEALDLTVYCYCMADVWLDLELERVRRAYQAQGCTRAQVEAITTKTIIDKLALLAAHGK